MYFIIVRLDPKMNYNCHIGPKWPLSRTLVMVDFEVCFWQAASYRMAACNTNSHIRVHGPYMHDCSIVEQKYYLRYMK